MAAEVLLTPEETAQRLKISERTVVEWLRRGRLAGVKVGRLWRVRPRELRRFLREGERRAVGSAVSAPCAQPQGVLDLGDLAPSLEPEPVWEIAAEFVDGQGEDSPVARRRHRELALL
jgi:excisionase family DNA binding protein